MACPWCGIRWLLTTPSNNPCWGCCYQQLSMKSNHVNSGDLIPCRLARKGREAPSSLSIFIPGISLTVNSSVNQSIYFCSYVVCMIKERQAALPWTISQKMDFMLWGEPSEKQGLEVDFSQTTANDFRVMSSAKLLSLHNYSYNYTAKITFNKDNRHFERN